MRTENRVSLWLGHAPSRQVLDDYVQLDFNEDGDYIPSRLMEAFGIPSYDEDFLEVNVFAVKNRSLQALLAGCSYDETIIKAFEALVGAELCYDANAVVLLYNYDAQIDIGKIVTEDDLQLRFMGVADYENAYT